MRHRKFSFSLPLSVVVASALLADRAEGSLFQYDFKGHVEMVTTSGPGVPGYDFNGRLIYDDAIPLGETHKDFWGHDERSYASGTYRPGDSTPDGTMLQLWFDGKAVAPESTGLFGGLVTITGGDGVTRSELVFRNSPRTEEGQVDDRGLALTFKVDPSVLASGRFPDGLTVADLPDVRISISGVMNGKFYERNDFNYVGKVDSFEIKPVPEPSWTVAALLAASAWTLRRRSVRGRATPAHGSR